MNERGKSNLHSWLWFGVAIVMVFLAEIGLIVLLLEETHVGVTLAFLAAVSAALFLVVCVARSFAEDDAPGEVPASVPDEFAATRARGPAGRLAAAIRAFFGDPSAVIRLWLILLMTFIALTGVVHFFLLRPH